jgi:hypothetical protein
MIAPDEEVLEYGSITRRHRAQFRPALPDEPTTGLHRVVPPEALLLPDGHEDTGPVREVPVCPGVFPLEDHPLMGGSRCRTFGRE